MAFSPKESMASRRQALGLSALGLTSAFGLVACGSSADNASSSASATPSKKPKYAGKVSVVPENEATEHNPTHPATVTGEEGTTLKSVKLVNDTTGAELKGTLSDDKTTWTSSEDLEFDTQYTLMYTAIDSQKVEGKGESTFGTVTAANQADAWIPNVQEGGVYGVGQILEFHFSEPVVNKDAIEKLISVTGKGVGEGKIRWYSDTVARWRTEDYLPARTAITAKANILGVDLGNGMIGNSNLVVNFSTSDKRYALADNNTKTMQMFVNDKLVNTVPITLGNEDWPSVVGKLVVIEQEATYKFDPTTLGLKKGDPHWYEPFTAHNTSRLTNSGVFVHQALPSAYAYVGVGNVSHGCLGMMPADAQYFFDTFDVGDIVETVNTGYPMADPDNGYGDWNIPFASYSDENYKGDW